MLDEIRGLVKRQYLNLKVFKAYTLSALMKEAFLFPKDLLSDSGASSNVLNIALFVTARCNAKCAMCNISGMLNDGARSDMPLQNIEKLLDDVARYKPSIILFGGEPSIRKDIKDIVRAVKKRGLGVGMFTNGIMLSADAVDGLVKEGLDYIAFSLQGPKEVHDRILAVPGAYDKMVNSIKLFANKKPRDTKVVIHATICEYNVNHLKDIAKFALDLGVDLVRFGHPTFYSAEEEKRFTAALSKTFKDASGIKAASYIYDIRGKEDIYIRKIKELKDEFRDKISFTPELGSDELKGWYSPDFHSKRKCLFVWRGLFIHPNGDAYPCESVSYKMGNVLEEGFDSVWNGARYKEFRRAIRRGLLPACARCCKL